MEITVGTFNLNNLFSRFNFKARVDQIPEEERDITVSFEFTEEGDYWFRTFRGRLIQPMPEEQRKTLAERIKAIDLDVLAVQEVEDIEALREFNRFDLNRMYRYVALLEGNDARFIDVGVLSKLPLEPSPRGSTKCIRPISRGRSSRATCSRLGATLLEVTQPGFRLSSSAFGWAIKPSLVGSPEPVDGGPISRSQRKGISGPAIASR